MHDVATAHCRRQFCTSCGSRKCHASKMHDVATAHKRKEDAVMERRSLLIKDTTREERIRIVQEGLNQCGGACDFCNGCENLGGGPVDAFYEPYINGEKELRQLNEEYRSNTGMIR